MNTKTKLLVAAMILFTLHWARPAAAENEWPREIIADGRTVLMYQPQLDKLDGNILYQTKPGAKGKKTDPDVFNLNSPVQLLAKFTALLGEAPVDMKTGKKSASKSALQEYIGEHKLIADYLRWKRSGRFPRCPRAWVLSRHRRERRCRILCGF